MDNDVICVLRDDPIDESSQIRLIEKYPNFWLFQVVENAAMNFFSSFRTN